MNPSSISSGIKCDADCPTILLDDRPANSDFFGTEHRTGPHSRISSAVSRLINDEENSGGIVIGLQGEWGSGKSTVINLLSEQFRSKEECTMLVFDAWAHEADPLRRTFLEFTLDHLQQKGWIPKNETWLKKAKTIAGQLIEKSEERNAFITRLGKYFGLSIFLIPIGIALLKDMLPLQPSWNIFQRFWWQAFFGYTLSFGFVIVLATNYVQAFHKYRKAEKKTKPTISNIHKLVIDRKNWAFLSGETVSDISTTERKSGDPTSIEFESHFRDLIEEALAGNTRKIAFVLDNIDRVERHDALSIWSTLQTFVRSSKAIKEPWFKRVWFIVPYDRSGLHHLWNNESDSESDSNKISNSFFDKSFNVIFVVPPPVLTGWRRMLIDYFEKSLPLHKEEAESVYRVFNSCRGTKTAPTPRELKCFVNQIGAIHRQWGSEFPFTDVSYFVILQRSRTDIADGLRHGTLPSEQAKDSCSDNLRRNLAGLVFNETANTGQQLLLAEPIFSSLSNGDEDALIRLLTPDPASFWAVVEADAKERIHDFTPKSLGNTAELITRDPFRAYSNRYEYFKLEDFITKRLSNLEQWHPFTNDHVSGFVSLLHILKDPSEQISLIDKLNSGYRLNQELIETKEDRHEIVQTLKLLSVKIENDFPSLAKSIQFQLSWSLNEWTNMCSILASESESFTKRFKMGIPSQAVANQCVVEADAVIKNCHILIDVSSRIDENIDWDNFVTRAGFRFEATSPVYGDEARNLLRSLVTLSRRKNTKARDLLKRLAAEGFLANCLSDPETLTDNEFAAMTLAIYMRYLRSLERPPAFGHSSAGFQGLVDRLEEDSPTLATNLLKELKSDKNGERFSILFDSYPSSPLLLECLKQEAEEKSGWTVLNVAFVLAKWNFLKSHLQDSKNTDRFSSFVESFIEKGQLTDLIIGQSEFQAEKSEVFSDILTMADTDDAFKEWIRSGLEALSAEDWANSLKEDARVATLLKTLTRKGKRLIHITYLQDGLSTFLKDCIENSSYESLEGLPKFPELINLFGDHASRLLIRRSVVKSLSQFASAPSPELLEWLEEGINDRETLLSNDNLIERILIPTLKNADPTRFGWLAQIAKKSPSLLEEAVDREIANDFHRRAIEIVDNLDEHSEEWESLKSVIHHWNCGRVLNQDIDSSTSDGGS